MSFHLLSFDFIFFYLRIEINFPMNIVLYDVNGRKSRSASKDFAGNYGTALGHKTPLARFRAAARKAGVYLPLTAFGSLSGILKQEGHAVSYMTAGLPGPSTDWVIIHSSLVDHRDEVRLAREIRTRLGCATTFIGPAAAFSEAFDDAADSIIAHEPEQIVWDVARGKRSIPKGRESSPEIQNLDDLPFPDWSIYPAWNRFRYLPSLKVWPVFPVLSSRGCAYKCQYCPYIAHFDAWRYRSPENVVDELEWLVKRFGARGILFRDPLFSSPRERALRIARLIVQKRINIRFACETRIDCLDPDLIDALYAAGLRTIKVGIESPNIALLNAYSRGQISADRQKEIIHYCRKKGVNVTAFYILGFPEDTKDDIEKTIRYSQILNSNVATFSLFTPYPGMPGEGKVKKSVYATDLSLFDTNHATYHHPHLTASELEKAKDRAYFKYYFRSGYIGQFLRLAMQ